MVAAEQRGAKVKKRLAVYPVEAETVRLMFRLFREGDGTSGPMGVKTLTAWLDERGHRTRVGARWGIGQLHKILTSPTYKGEYRFNRKVWKTKEAKPQADQVAIAVDPIIDVDTFGAVQAMLRARNPRVAPPRIVTGPILLTGLATCAGCGGGMTLRTGKSGRYRYYTCGTCAQKGKVACEGRSVPMDRLDDVVTGQIVEKLLTPERVRALLSGLIERQAARDADQSQRLTALREKFGEAERRLGQIYQAIENCDADVSDPTLKDRVAAQKTERDIARAAFDRAAGEVRPEARVTEDRITAFTQVMRENVRHGDITFRRAYLRSSDRPGRSRRRGNPHSRPPDGARAARYGRRRDSGRSAQFCSQVARPTGFEPVASAFGGQFL